jgi:hypothetical protein
MNNVGTAPLHPGYRCSVGADIWVILPAVVVVVSCWTGPRVFEVVLGTFEKLEVPVCSEFSGDSGNAIKKIFFFGGPSYVHTTLRCLRNFSVEKKSWSQNAQNGLKCRENE